MSDDEYWELDTRRRDTSWVEGEVASSIDNFPQKVKRWNTSARYHLLDRETFREVIQEDLLNHRKYWNGRFSCEAFAFGFASRFWQRHGVNGVGVVVDYARDSLYNIVVYEQGGVEFYNPESRVMTQPMDYEPDSGLVIL